MTAEFDLNLLPVYRIKGQELPQLPGLLASTPPKRAARGREEDALLIYLTISGNTPISFTEYNHLMSQMAQQFYKTPGSLTFAVRAAADWLNQFLLNRNLGTTTKGQYIVGRLILGALRSGQCLFAQCGPTHIFQLSGKESRHIHDPQIAGHGLGIGQTTPIYLAQVELHPNDLLILCPDLPQGWESALISERNLSPELLHRKLLGVNGEDLNGVMIQARPGKGRMTVLRSPRPSAKKAGSNPVDTAQPAAAATTRPSAQVESERPASRFSRLISGVEATPASGTNIPIPTTQPAVDKKDEPAAEETSAIPAQVLRHTDATAPVRRPAGNRPRNAIPPRTSGEIPEIKRPGNPRRKKAFQWLAKIIGGTRRATQAAGRGVGKFLPNLVPGHATEGENSGPSLALLAVVIPVVIVAIAATLYVQYGRTAQFNSNFTMAVNQADLARGQTDATEVRRAWDSTIYYLDQAEKSMRNQPQAVALRQEAQTALDNLDGILRLDFRPAIAGGLSRTIQISKMAATDTDLYMLDSERGDVIRATLTNQTYEVDTSFKCAPGIYEDVIVDKLVGLVALPMTNIYNARIMGMDAKGTLIYCGLSDPTAVALVPPQLGWKKIAAFTLDTDGKNLYVLDPGSNAVWQYVGDYGRFVNLPSMFFGEQVPQNMGTAIAMAANSADMYLLFQDGHVTSCPLTHIAVVPLRCNDPATFKDSRPESQPGPRINDAIFTQMTFASVPDPSLYMLEPLTRAVYRFSPRADSLELRGQFRASMQQEQESDFSSGPAGSMTIGLNRYIFISVGNQVFFAADVP